MPEFVERDRVYGDLQFRVPDLGRRRRDVADAKLLAGERSVRFDAGALPLRALSFAQDALAGIETLAVFTGPIGVDRELVQQTVLIDPWLDEQAVRHFRK